MGKNENVAKVTAPIYLASLERKYGSAMKYVLTSLIPYTEANLKLAFKPNVFFNDLETLDRLKLKKQSVRNAYNRAIAQKLIKLDTSGRPSLSKQGQLKVGLFKPRRLNTAKLMVMFDIPETSRKKRDHLRGLLKSFGFRQIQKSIWESDYDYFENLIEFIESEQLRKYVSIYEAHKLS